MIVVSGTRGKSTLATLLARVIADAGYSCPLLGNIGTPPLPAYDPSNPPDYAVIELSSYMLDRLEKRNFISILTNIFPDHLDWHGSMEAYVAAKLRVIRGSDHAFVSAQVAQCGYLQKYAQLYGELPSHEVFGAGGRYGYSDGCWMRDGKELFSSERMKII
ncbi:MAG TPA: Mur ligase family protein [bacterium]|nr:Mur ligase family protein [bacterium]